MLNITSYFPKVGFCDLLPVRVFVSPRINL
jgi:hypothetical protein